MDEKIEVYESPEIVTFGQLDFEPMVDGCSTSVTCDGAAGGCIAVFALPG